MVLCDFSYHRPESLAEAHALSRRLGPAALYLAGGTEIIPDFRRGADAASHLIALDRIADLASIATSAGHLRIGAMATIREVAAATEVRRFLPALAEAALSVGSPQIRNLATIGGNFCRAVPCADTPPPCIAAGARLRIAGENGIRVVTADAFFVGPRKTLLEPGEILLEIVIPAQPPSSGVSYQRFARRRGSALAVASVAARLVLDGDRIASARVALGSVAPVPMLAERTTAILEGERATDDVFARAAAEAAAEALPITDIRGTAAFRRHLVEVLARRAFADAAHRARVQAT
jgi:CO/xanthine dehydrogenase FAD-binding subunit